MFIQQSYQFIFKRDCLMMFSLIFYIADKRFLAWNMLCEFAIPNLPTREIRKYGSFPGDQSMTGFLNIFYEIWRAYCRMKMSDNMNMINCSSHNIGMTWFLFQHSCYITKQNILISCWNKWDMTFTAEDELIQKLSVSWHISHILAQE